jgi:hypothetical protein
MNARTTAAETVAGLISEYRYVIGNEREFQEGLSRVLELSHVPFLREHDLGPFGRIDFFLPESEIGIELKVKGSLTAVLRQLHQYALSPGIQSLILVTTRDRLTRVPQTLNGKPLRTASIWMGQF